MRGKNNLTITNLKNTTAILLGMAVFLFSALSFAGSPTACFRFYKKEQFAYSHELKGVSNQYDPYWRKHESGVLAPANGLVEVTLVNHKGEFSDSWLDQWMHFSGLSFFRPSMVFHNQGLDTIFKGYGPAIDQNIVNKVIQAEHDISVARTSAFAITPDHSPDNVLGFFRVLDGSFYPHPDGINKYETDYDMPLELILRASGIDEVPIITQDRKNLHTIYEMGKYFIDPKLPADVKLTLKNMIYRWLDQMIIAPIAIDADITFFYAHVATEVHRKAFKREFGMEAVTDPKLNGGLQPPQYILRAPLSVFHAKIKEHLSKNGFRFYR